MTDPWKDKQVPLSPDNQVRKPVAVQVPDRQGAVGISVVRQLLDGLEGAVLPAVEDGEKAARDRHDVFVAVPVSIGKQRSRRGIEVIARSNGIRRLQRNQARAVP